MYEELISELYLVASGVQSKNRRELLERAADAIAELTAERDKYKRHSDAISKLPDCNTCGKKAKGTCEFMPNYGDWVRINCAFWAPEPPKEE